MAAVPARFGGRGHLDDVVDGHAVLRQRVAQQDVGGGALLVGDLLALEVGDAVDGRPGEDGVGGVGLVEQHHDGDGRAFRGQPQRGVGGDVGAVDLAGHEGRVDVAVGVEAAQRDVEAVLGEVALVLGDPPGSVAEPRLGAHPELAGLGRWDAAGSCGCGGRLGGGAGRCGNGDAEGSDASPATACRDATSRSSGRHACGCHGPWGPFLRKQPPTFLLGARRSIGRARPAKGACPGEGPSADRDAATIGRRGRPRHPARPAGRYMTSKVSTTWTDAPPASTGQPRARSTAASMESALRMV